VLVQTHRDPLKVTASFTSMLSYSRRNSERHPDPNAIGAYWAARIETMLRRSMEDRPPEIAERIVDVQFSELNRDPIGVVKRVYEVADRELTAAAEGAMRAFLASNPRGKHGAHDYRLEDFGLDPDERRHALAFYCERFGVPIEP
ncbi:MAG: sulfotransferase, partial [Myxococcales bacterium]|nr:sulfotransferase [Myxococcales bacterium]